MTRDPVEEEQPGATRDVPPVSAVHEVPSASVYQLPARLGRYLLTQRLGVGGMAEVFLAQQDGPAGFQKTCVVKRILPHLAVEPRFVSMFQREARVAAMLAHSNVVQTFELAEEAGVYFIAMEYVDGPPLHQLARAAWRVGKPLPMELIGCAIADCALGLSAAHALTDRDGKPLKLIHRDISPDNLIINSEGVVKILDFGVARIESNERTATGELKGKLPFISPEQIRGDAVDERVDLYALGVTAYWLLTGARPFSAPSDLSLMQTILSEPPRPPRELNPNVPPELEALVLRMLAKDPQHRPANAGEIADAMTEATAARRHVVAPFVKSMQQLSSAAPLESSPREGSFVASIPQSATFATACQGIARHLTPAPETALGTQSTSIETQPTGPVPLSAAAATPTAADLRELDLDREAAGIDSPVRLGWRVGALGALALAVLVGAAMWALRPAAPSGPVATTIVEPPIPVAPTPPVVQAPPQSAPVEPPPTPPTDGPVAATLPTREDASAPPDDRVKSPARRTDATRDVEARGPAHVQWLDARGRVLGSGDARLKLGAADKKITAFDRRRGVRSAMAVSSTSVDYAALPRGKLQLRANPYADVLLGKESLGTTPFPPVDVVAGSYKVTFRFNGREEVRTIEVAPGGTARAAVDFGG